MRNMNAEPTLSGKGWITTPIEAVKYIIADYMVADANQSSLLPTVRNFMRAHGAYSNSPEGLCETMRSDLTYLIESVLPTVEVNVNYIHRINDFGDESGKYDIDIVVKSPDFSTVPDDTALSYRAYIDNGHVKNHIFNYMQD